MMDCAWTKEPEELECVGKDDNGDKLYTIKRPRANCMVCGREFYKDEMTEIQTSRVQYECDACRELGTKKARSRLNERAYVCKKYREQMKK